VAESTHSSETPPATGTLTTTLLDGQSEELLITTAEISPCPQNDSPASETALSDVVTDCDDSEDNAEAEFDPQGAQEKSKRRKRPTRAVAMELKLLGRRALCKGVGDIAPHMLKTVKLRILGRYLESKKGLEDDDLTEVIRKDAGKLAERGRVLKKMKEPDLDFSRGQLKAVLFNILLQEETYSIDETRLEEKVIEFEKKLVKQSRTLDLTEMQRQDPDRWHHYETYRIVLEAA
jgi:hypothetical protein